jgi:tripartite-type tricarboxylate transporter receptor subunit TctC
MIKLTCLVAFAGFSAMPLVAQAQSYPSRSITVVVPFPAGGPSDVVARIVTERMSRTLGQQMVIENVGGAGGTLGSARVAAARPDGYTLLAGSMGSHVAAPVLTPAVAYRGTGPAMNDLVGGHVDFLCEQSVSVAEQIKAGTVKGYVVSANQRLAALPDIPSAKEAGINYQMSIWAGIFAPKGTPKETIAKLAAALDKALDDPLVRERLAELGGSIRPSRRERP